MNKWDTEFYEKIRENDKQQIAVSEKRSAVTSAILDENLLKLNEGSKNDAIAYQRAELKRKDNVSDNTPRVNVSQRVNALNEGVEFEVKKKPVLEGIVDYHPMVPVKIFIANYGRSGPCNSIRSVDADGGIRDYLHAKNAGKYFDEVAGVFGKLAGSQSLDNVLYRALFDAKKNGTVSGLIEKQLESIEGVSGDEALTLNTYVLGKMLDYAGYTKDSALDSLRMPKGVKIEGKFYPAEVFSGMDKSEVLSVMKANDLNLAGLIKDPAGVGAYVFNINGAYSNYVTAATALISAKASRPSSNQDLKSIYETAKNVVARL